MGGGRAALSKANPRNGFDPRPRMGGGEELERHVVRYEVFRSTPPHGRRPAVNAYGDEAPRFDPRPRMGGGAIAGDTAIMGKVSIHAPAWEAATQFLSTPSVGDVSIHAPAWEAATKPAKRR